MKILIYGSVNIDYTYQVKDIVKPGETIHCTFSGKAAGGKGANQAYAVAMAAGKDIEVFFAGKADHEADFIFEKMRGAGISCNHVTYSDLGTGLAIIQVSESGQNSILVCSNGNAHIEKSEIDRVLSDFSEGDCIILNAEINNLQYLIERCNEKGMVIFFNPSPVSEELKSLPLEKVSFLVFNEVEGAFFSSLSSSAEPKTILDALSEKYPQSAIVLTLGSDGAFFRDSSETVFVPACKVSAIDTTGCGDTFLGFFAVETMNGINAGNALQTASKAAGLAATRPGAMNSIPDRSEIV